MQHTVILVGNFDLVLLIQLSRTLKFTYQGPHGVVCLHPHFILNNKHILLQQPPGIHEMSDASSKMSTP